MQKKPEQNFGESRVYWFVILDHAAEIGNFALAAEAQEQLGRLGVNVQFKKRPGQALFLADQGVPCEE